MDLRQYFRKAADSLLRPAGDRSRHRPPKPTYRPRLEMLETRELLSTFTVVLDTDKGGPAGQKVSAISGDLRYCVEQVDATHTATTDTIGFSSSLFAVPQLITLNSANGPLVLSDSHPLTINAPTARTVTVSGGGATSVFAITGTVIMKNLTISNGSASFGGGIITSGVLNITNSAISYCAATDGGGIVNQGTITLTSCSLDHDSAVFSGSAIDNFGTAKLINSILYRDSAGSIAALLNQAGTVSLTGCTVSNNSGGGIVNISGTATLTNCKLSNDTGNGVNGSQAFWNSNGGTATLSGCTFSNDSNKEGAAIENVGTASLMNCILSSDSAGDDGGGRRQLRHSHAQ